MSSPFTTSPTAKPRPGRRAATARSGGRRPSAPAPSDRRVAAGTRAARRPSNATAARSRGRAATVKKVSLPATAPGDGLAAGLTLLTLALTLFGLVMVLSAASVQDVHDATRASPFYHFTRQAMWAGLGAVGFVLASRLPYTLIRRLSGVALALTLLAMAALLVPGVGQEVNGSTRWLALGPIQLQPSEFAKLAMVLFVADLLARRERQMHRPEMTVRPVMVLLIAAGFLLMMQPKLGSTVIIGMICFSLLFVAGASIRSMLPWLGLMLLGAVTLAMSASYRRDRVLSFFNPGDDPSGDSLQAIQSQVGIASGGLLGTGLGAGRAKWGFLPYPHSDFIFAVVAEEVGLLGACALIGAFVLLTFLGIRAALAAPDRFGLLLAAGLTCWLVGQAFLNIGMVAGLLPVTGEPLPFVSAGGSSLMVSMVATGLLVNVARHGRAR